MEAAKGINSYRINVRVNDVEKLYLIRTAERETDETLVARFKRYTVYIR